MPTYLLAAVVVLAASGARTQPGGDTDSIANLMRAYYEVISGPAGRAPDRARDESLHAPGAIVGFSRATGDGGTAVDLMTLAGFYEKFGGTRDEPFYEWELHRVTRQYGNIAHVWSSHAMGKAPGKADARGVTTLQLRFDGSRWAIVSWLTDLETAKRPIPSDLLPQSSTSPTVMTGDEAAIRDLVKQYNNAREANDPKAIEALFVADADQLVSSGEWRRGRDVLVKGAMASSARTGGTRTLTVESIRMVAPDAAIADARYEISGLPDGSTRKMWSTFVVVREGLDGGLMGGPKAPPARGVWRISAIRNMLPAVAPTPR
jgi:uncharacterized protein (TIGR02246 family)